MTPIPSSTWLALSLAVVAVSAADAQRTITPPPAFTSGDAVVHENAEREDPKARFVGRLRRPLLQYSRRGAEFRAQFSGKPWHGHIRSRECLDCPAGARSRMKIEAISNVHRDRLTGLPENGVVVGRVINVGRFVDKATRIAPTPEKLRPTELYYVIVDRGDSTSADLFIAKVSFDEKGAVRDSVEIEASPRPYRKCASHVEPKRRTSEGDFRRCPGEDDRIMAPPTAQQLPASPLNLVRPAAFTGGSAGARPATADALAWFSCDAGCCTAQFPPRSDTTVVGPAMRPVRPAKGASPARVAKATPALGASRGAR